MPVSDVPTGLEGGPYEPVETDVGRIWMLQSDRVMRDYMQYAKTWEPEEGRLLARLARPGLRFLDVGANVGYFSIFVSRLEPSATIHSVEPNPAVVPLLRFNLRSNGVEATVWPVALGEEPGAVALSSAPSNLGDTRTSVVDGDHYPRASVPMERGDDLWPDDIAFDVVKLDVQGAELEAVRGMLGTLKRNANVVLVAELWPSALRERGDDPVATVEAYKDLGFEIAVQVGDDLFQRTSTEIVDICDSGGYHGQVNLVLHWAERSGGGAPRLSSAVDLLLEPDLT